MNDKNTYINEKSILALAAGIFAILLGVLYGCMLLSYYHADTGYMDGILPGILCAVAFLLFFSLGAYTAYICNVKATDVFFAAQSKETLIGRIVKGILAAGFLMISLVYVCGDPSDPLKNPDPSASALLVFCARWSVIFAVTAGICLLLFVIFLPENPNLRFLLYFPASLFTLTYALRRYLDTRVLLVDQRRMLSVLAIALLALFIVGELRLLTGRFSAYYYALTGFSALCILSLSGVGSLVLHLGKGASDGIQLAFTAFEALAAFYVCARLVHVFGQKIPEIPDAAPDDAAGNAAEGGSEHEQL